MTRNLHFKSSLHPIMYVCSILEVKRPNLDVLKINFEKLNPPPLMDPKAKVRYRVHKSPPLVAILSQLNPVHTFLPYFSKIHSNNTHLRLGLPSGSCPSDFSSKILYACHLPMRAIYPTHFILLHLIILIIFA
jgi:hypothetical protein